MNAQNSSKVLVLTGGSYGIGLGIAERFVADGYRVVIIGRDQAKLDKAIARIGPRARAERGDVGIRTDVERFAAAIAGNEGRVDVLINNAGILELLLTGGPLDEAEAVFDRLCAANLKGPYLVTHALSGLLTSPGGRVINIGSMVAESGGSIPGYSAYAPVKAGVHGLTLAFAREFSARGITVNTISPGYTEATGQTEAWTGARVEPIIANIPMKRAGTAGDIAAACAYLASEGAGYVTGATLPVNGGWRFY
jgi:3-oxoacyl-[acyl-carrier protein] reductase